MIRNFISGMARILAPRRREFVIILIIMAVYEVLKLIPSYLSKMVLDTVSVPNMARIEYIVVLGFILFCTQRILAAIDMVGDQRIFHFLHWAENYLPISVQKKLLSLSMGYHEREQTGEKIIRLERGTDRLFEFTAHLLWLLFPLFMQVVWTFAFLTYLDWQIAIVFSLAVPLFVALTWRLNRKTYGLRSQQENAYEESAGRLTESIMNIQMVQSYAQEGQEHTAYRAIRDRITQFGMQQILLRTRMNFYRHTIVDAARFFILVLAAEKAIAHELSVGTVALIFTLTEKVYTSLFSLSQVIDRMVEASEPMGRLFELLDTKPDVADPANPQQPSEWHGGIEFKEVGFEYSPGRSALNSISFKIKPGETVAFAGPSGSGKSTLVKLLLRFYDPSNGSITIDGIDIRDLTLEDLHRQIGYVSQDVQVMSGSVRHNITYGRPNATDEEVAHVARLARVDEFVAQLPDGYNTVVGERGMKLSGGQRQRLGIARALLTNPSILVFDEATSSLDAESERAIQDALVSFAGSKTMLVIAHRMSTIMHADKIVVIEKGKVAEVGDHATLMRRNGLYERLVRLQTQSAK